jgi:hypothetical protein
MAEDSGIAIFACYNVTFSATNDIWMTDDVIVKRVPLLCLQIAYDLLVARFFYFILKPIRAPLIVAQILVSIHSFIILTFFFILMRVKSRLNVMH